MFVLIRQIVTLTSVLGCTFTFEETYMKSATLGLCALIVVCAGSAAKAQCGCGASYPSYPSYPAYQPSYPAYPSSHSAPGHYPQASYPQPALPAPRPTGNMGPANIAYVNKLATPVARSNYTLNYAVHLTDGRILLSDFLPAGQTVRGVETQSGTGGRRLNASNTAGGTITVVDPANNSTVANFGPTGG